MNTFLENQNWRYNKEIWCNKTITDEDLNTIKEAIRLSSSLLSDYNLIKFFNWKSRIKSTNKTVRGTSSSYWCFPFISICK
jgi:hypothetical protein